LQGHELVLFLAVLEDPELLSVENDRRGDRGILSCEPHDLAHPVHVIEVRLDGLE